MKTAWTKGLDAEKKEEMKRDFQAASLLRERLRQLLLEKSEVRRKKGISEDSYVNPNWVYLQADAVGYQRALEEVISLLEA